MLVDGLCPDCRKRKETDEKQEVRRLAIDGNLNYRKDLFHLLIGGLVLICLVVTLFMEGNETCPWGVYLLAFFCGASLVAGWKFLNRHNFWVNPEPSIIIRFIQYIIKLYIAINIGIYYTPYLVIKRIAQIISNHKQIKSLKMDH